MEKIEWLVKKPRLAGIAFEESLSEFTESLLNSAYDYFQLQIVLVQRYTSETKPEFEW